MLHMFDRAVRTTRGRRQPLGFRKTVTQATCPGASPHRRRGIL